MKAGLIELKDMQLMGITGGEMLQKELKAGTIAVGEFEQEMFTAGRFDQTVEIIGLETPLHGPDRLDAGCGDAPPRDGVQPKATFIATPVAHRAGLIAVLVQGVEDAQSQGQIFF